MHSKKEAVSRALLDPVNGDNTFLPNVGELLPDYMTSYPRR
jgi:hypothetical protein